MILEPRRLRRRFPLWCPVTLCRTGFAKQRVVPVFSLNDRLQFAAELLDEMVHREEVVFEQLRTGRTVICVQLKTTLKKNISKNPQYPNHKMETQHNDTTVSNSFKHIPFYGMLL